MKIFTRYSGLIVIESEIFFKLCAETLRPLRLKYSGILPQSALRKLKSSLQELRYPAKTYFEAMKS
jgi:hypothetical protein